MTGGNDHLHALARAHTLLVEAEVRQRDTVHAARRAGATWDAIGERIEMTAQGAHAKYGHDAPDAPALPGLSVRDYARTVSESAAHITANLDHYPHVVIPYRGQQIVRILGEGEVVE